MFQITGIPQPSNLQGFKFKNYVTLGDDIVSRLLAFAIIGAGLLFFVRLLTAGFQFLTSAGDSSKIQSATKDLTNGTIGLLVVISSYFLIQLIEVVFGLTIL